MIQHSFNTMVIKYSVQVIIRDQSSSQFHAITFFVTLAAVKNMH